MSEVVEVSAGTSHSLAVREDGSLWAWGNNDRGQLGDGTTAQSNHPKKIMDSGVKKAIAGNKYSLIVKDDGRLWAWGWCLWTIR